MNEMTEDTGTAGDPQDQPQPQAKARIRRVTDVLIWVGLIVVALVECATLWRTRMNRQEKAAVASEHPEVSASCAAPVTNAMVEAELQELRAALEEQKQECARLARQLEDSRAKIDAAKLNERVRMTQEEWQRLCAEELRLCARETELRERRQILEALMKDPSGSAVLLMTTEGFSTQFTEAFRLCQELRQKLAQQLTGYTESHPEVINTRRQLKAAEELYAIAVKGELVGCEKLLAMTSSRIQEIIRERTEKAQLLAELKLEIEPVTPQP